MNHQPENYTLDYLIMGHITRDLVEDGNRPGGTALYSGILAQRMGLQVGLITSCQEDMLPEELVGFEIINRATQNRTTFKNIYTLSGREQYLIEKAEDLDFSMIPESWHTAKILHLGPVAREIPLSIDIALQATSVCYSLQGWLRDWDLKGKVYNTALPDLPLLQHKRSAAFVSIEDLGNTREAIEQLRSKFPLLVLTRGKEGAEIFQGKEIINIPAKPLDEKDPTGAGDIFAAAFMIYWVLRGKSIVESAGLAAKLAALSVTRLGLEGIPAVKEIRKIEE